MQIHKLFKTILITVLALSFCSCNKYLDLKPQDGLTRQDFWQSKEQIQSAVIGIYSSMLSAQGDRALPEYLFMWGELRADMIAPYQGGTSNDELNIISDNVLASNGITNWRVFYRIINYCNTVLDYAPGVLKVDNTLTQAQLNAYLSEALAIRSLMYFYLVRTFGDVPLKLKSTSSDNDLVQLAKTSQQDVLKQVVTDLNTAEGYALPTYGNSITDRGRITKFTINTLQADVYLWMDQYENCITACDKVINSGRYGLITGDAGWFVNLFVNGNSNEGIFELQYDSQVLNPFYNMFLTTKRRYLAEPNIIEDFYGVDLSDDNNRDIRGVDVAVHIADLTIWKYVGLTATTLRTQDISYAHWMVYRYADVLLMKAEACANSGKGQTTLDIISQIRRRAHALDNSAVNSSISGTSMNVDPTDVGGLTDYILAERAREFAFEGKRWFDVLRNAKRNNYARLDLLLNMAARSVPADNQQAAINKFKDARSHYLPIYQYELTTDPNLVQNPFYK
ncbi:RagB/SusD family nutrient uptake outer membrane protein [Mucilaginibacter robiniae]|uniref:RagB/SusD family nutrient uptake outer membrane protein n=1 Tax=Mucilaginibacter robiniae TaxID=2728022 RepID=A0A7L5DYX7_9SPHI|nr:RagB/SusD family nutrient uptake outer membrane protein [Mucilaginibacter robiniae]QJD95249.1 RagB/SusD family nutrient uptake outer membrane protein [Mucilaginibacter robiniae]